MPADRRGLPRRPFFYTLDQVADMLSLTELNFTKSYVWKVGTDVGAWRPRFVRAVKIGDGWRIGEEELLRWMKYSNIYIYDPYLGNEEIAKARVTPDPELLDL